MPNRSQRDKNESEWIISRTLRPIRAEMFIIERCVSVPWHGLAPHPGCVSVPWQGLAPHPRLFSALCPQLPGLAPRWIDGLLKCWSRIKAILLSSQVLTGKMWHNFTEPCLVLLFTFKKWCKSYHFNEPPESVQCFIYQAHPTYLASEDLCPIINVSSANFCGYRFQSLLSNQCDLLHCYTQ